MLEKCEIEPNEEDLEKERQKILNRYKYLNEKIII
jgi:hypothetical protein